MRSDEIALLPGIINHEVDINTLEPHPRNFRSHPEQQIHNLAASYRRFGQFRSIVAIEHSPGRYLIIAGHGITEAMKREGAKTVRIDELPKETDAQTLEAIMIADNLHPLEAVDDNELLTQLLQEQQDTGFSLASMGMDDEALREMLESLGDAYLGSSELEESDGTEDELPEEVETRCKVGDVWQLGKHRLICADSFDPVTYTLLLGDRQPHAIITDPPYGMRLDADYSVMKNSLGLFQASGLRSGHKYADVIGDDTDFNASAIVNYFPYVKEQFWFGADYYSATLDDTMHTGCWLVWDKRLDESADLMFGSCFELIWSKQKHKRDILRHKWAGVFGLEHEPMHKRQHPTQKPVRLLEDMLTRYTTEGQIILDIFLGSGSTLVSCERTRRVCYGCELSPAYCDVTIARWEQATGKQAEKLIVQ